MLDGNRQKNDQAGFFKEVLIDIRTQLMGSWKYEQVQTIIYGSVSYNLVNNIIEFLLQYHMALAFVTASSFAAATSISLMWAAGVGIALSLLAPVIHHVWPQSAGKVLPTLLLVGSVLFFLLILFPELFSGLVVSPLVLACIVGSGMTIALKTCRFNFTEVFNNQQWALLENSLSKPTNGENNVEKPTRDGIQKAVGLYVNRPTQAISSILIMLLTAFFVPFSVAKWIFAGLVLPVALFWCYIVYNADNVKPTEKKFALPFGDDNFWLMTIYSVSVHSSTALLMMFKATIIATFLGAVYIPYLKLAFVPLSILTKYILQKIKNNNDTLPFETILFGVVMALLVFTAAFYCGIPTIITCASIGLSLLLDSWGYLVWEFIYTPSNTTLFQENAGQYLPWINFFVSIAQMGVSAVALYLTQTIGLSCLHLLVVSVSVFIVLNIAVSVLYNKIDDACRAVKNPAGQADRPIGSSSMKQVTSENLKVKADSYHLAVRSSAERGQPGKSDCHLR